MHLPNLSLAVSPAKLKFTGNPRPGIYYTDSYQFVALNCRDLNNKIRGDEEGAPFIDVRRYRNFTLYTLKVKGNYSQHMILNSAAKIDVKKFVETLPKQAADLICAAAQI